MHFGTFQSLALKKDIIHLNSKGKFIKSNSINIKYTPSSKNQAIFIVKKKIGKSPTRNKIKRQIRAILSEYQDTQSIYLMIIVKQEIKKLSFQEIKSEIFFLLTQISKKLKN